MSYLFRFIPFIFGRTLKTASTEKMPEHKGSKPAGTQKRRAAVNASVVSTTPLRDRKIVFRDNFLGRILTVLEHGPQLEKAARDCKKFLDSISRPDFDLGTLVPLLAPIKELDDPHFSKLFEKTINDTIRKTAVEAKKRGLAKQALSTVKIKIAHSFGTERKNVYNRPFRIAEQYKNALMEIEADRPANPCWTIFAASSCDTKKTGKEEGDREKGF